MTTNGTLVQEFFEGAGSYGYGSGAGYDVLTNSEAQAYTLESGASLIAMESRAELHELFELAVIYPNNAALAAKVEGYGNVLESATYGPVFEEASKKFGQRVIDFLIKLKDRVIAFFKNIFSRLTEMCSNYDKFLEKNGAALDKAASLKLYVRDWNDDKISAVGSTIQAQSTAIASLADLMVTEINKVVGKGTADDVKDATENFEKLLKKKVADTMAEFGFKEDEAKSNDNTRMNERLNRFFCGRDKKMVTATGADVKKKLTGVKDTTKDIRDAQKKYEKAYKDAIKKVEQITKNMESSEAKGYNSLIDKAVAAMSKVQNVINNYATAGCRAVISRASEATAIARCLIAGKASSSFKEKD